MSMSDFINDPFGAAGKAMADLAPDSVRETVHEAKDTFNDMAQSATSQADSATGGDFTDPNFDLGTYANEHGIAGPDLRSASGIIMDDKEHWDTNGPTVQAEPSMDPQASGIIHPDPFADGIAPTAGEQAEGYGAAGDVFGDAGTLGETTGPEHYSLGENSMQNDYHVDIGPAQIEDPNPISVDIGQAQIEEAEPEQTVGQQAQGVGADGVWGTSDYGGSAANDAAGTGAEGVYDDGTEGPNWTADPHAGAEGPAAPDYGPGATGQLAGAEGEVTGGDDSYF